MRLMFAVSLMCCVISGWGQDKLRFNSRNHIGLLEGQSGSAFQLHSINGVTFKRYFAGLGAGLDYYGSRSVPAYISLSADARLKPRTFFITAGAGLNFPWNTDNLPDWNTVSRKSTPGFYGAAHLGYRVHTRSGKDAFMLSLGYSYKHHREMREFREFCTNPPCGLAKEFMDYYYRRVSLLLGWQF